jgi:hypothetical protein
VAKAIVSRRKSSKPKKSSTKKVRPELIPVLDSLAELLAAAVAKDLRTAPWRKK